MELVIIAILFIACIFLFIRWSKAVNLASELNDEANKLVRLNVRYEAQLRTLQHTNELLSQKCTRLEADLQKRYYKTDQSSTSS
jgi:uncharacterized protein YoxC